MNSEAACLLIEQAHDYTDVFSDGPDDPIGQKSGIRKQYRRLASFVHPDIADDGTTACRREAAFKRLGELRAQAEDALKAGAYGRSTYVAIVTTKRAVHQVVRQSVGTDIVRQYRAVSRINDKDRDTLLRVAIDPRDNDLVTNEARSLKRLHGPDADPQWQPFVPELLDSFMMNDASKAAVNAVSFMDGFHDLHSVRQAFRTPFDPLHAVWIWRRLLVALGFAHDNGVIHGAVVPSHVNIHPELHGLILSDWCYASAAQDITYAPLAAIVGEYRDWYPPEVMAKQPPSPSTDIWMAARTLIDLMGGNPLTGNLPTHVHPRLRAFFRGCLSQSAAARPQNAWLLLEEFDELLETMGAPYYPRRFRPFTLPPRRV